MRLNRHGKWLAAGLVPLAMAGCGEPAPPTPGPAAAPAFTAEKVVVSPEIADFYRERGNRPLWLTAKAVNAEGIELARRIEGAADHGLDPERYGASKLKATLAVARGGDPRALAQAELLLSRAWPAFVRDLRLPATPGGMRYIDEGLAPEPTSPRTLLDAVAAGGRVADAARMNPLYEALRRGHAKWRATHPQPAPAEAALVRANLDRARAIPGGPGRYIVVDVASARLWMIDGERIEGPMRVIVGKPAMQTPAMAGLMRYVVLNPYWNLPPDLARDRARRVLREGTGFLRRERLQILSDWSDRARVVSPSKVDWRAVAGGRRALRMRQLPGGANVMGEVKFMMPNHLGIYLHDFPDKALFGRADRRLSSGCVRLEDAPRLARWLFRGAPPRPAGPAPEQRVDLPDPVPVYLTYLTMLPDPKAGLSFRRDVYGRDLGGLAGRRDGPGGGG